jgi:16S rRNA (uracil1498-N3)-methyltransferase
MNIFYEKNITKGIRSLSEEESRHCVNVLRHSNNDEIMIFDGSGGKHHSVLTNVSKNSCTFEIIESEIEANKKFNIHLAIAPTKNADRMEWLVEKLAEIGVDELTFLKTQHSERRKLRIDRLEKKSISAMKQSGNPFKLRINEIQEFDDFIGNSNTDKKFIAHVSTNHSYLGNVLEHSKDTCILIGPEGDFNNQEVDKAIKAGFQAVSLGKNTFRTETAGFVACCIVNTVNQF